MPEAQSSEVPVNQSEAPKPTPTDASKSFMQKFADRLNKEHDVIIGGHRILGGLSLRMLIPQSGGAIALGALGVFNNPNRPEIVQDISEGNYKAAAVRGAIAAAATVVSLGVSFKLTGYKHRNDRF